MFLLLCLPCCSGTGALKSGFTRTGKRTIGGILDDGVKSVTRYYVNNFQDGTKQDALDLVTGGEDGGRPFEQGQRYVRRVRGWVLRQALALGSSDNDSDQCNDALRVGVCAPSRCPPGLESAPVTLRANMPATH